ncbi:aminotransferase class IV [Pyruvatibacter sp.]|uniref:aminotransferase class IV n=1 Tax=Pyruvatibacter sp. TaxID=1981328 RepID=UPI0032EC856E
MTAQRIWFNGKLAPASETCITPNDRGLLLGDGLFETLLALNGRIIRLDRHIARLAEGAAVMKIPLPYETRTLRTAARETLEANGLIDVPRASLRITLTRGPSERGLALPATPRPSLMITAAKAAPPPKGLTLITSTVKKPAASPASSLKTLNYTDHVMARLEADAAGMDDALMLTTSGGIACSTIGNVFAVTREGLVTPAADGAIRAGITRADVLDAARQHHMSVAETEVTSHMLQAANEIFLTNSLWGICPVTGLDGATKVSGPVTKKLAQALDAAWASDLV